MLDPGSYRQQRRENWSFLLIVGSIILMTRTALKSHVFLIASHIR
jgi:hypothetical protein